MIKLTEFKIVEKIFSLNIRVIDPKIIQLNDITHNNNFFVVNRFVRSMFLLKSLIKEYL